MHPYIAVPAIVALVWRAYSRNSLTPAGLVVATMTAVVHAIHPWNVFFAMLVVFFLAGTAVTKVNSMMPGSQEQAFDSGRSSMMSRHISPFLQPGPPAEKLQEHMFRSSPTRL